MIPLSLSEVRELAPGRLDAVGNGGEADMITGVKVDSRRVEPGDLFVVVSRGEAAPQDAAVGKLGFRHFGIGHGCRVGRVRAHC